MTEHSDGTFRLALFNGFTLKDPQGALMVLGLRKAEGLLAYVAAAADQVASREALAGLLWGDFSQTKARQNLRQTLLDLSRAFAPYDPSPLRIDNQVIALEPGRFVVDIATFKDLVRANTMESLQQAMALQRGDFLAGVTVRASDFQSWASDLREEYHELGLRATTALLDLQEDAEQIELAIVTAKRGLQLDPLREDFHRHLIRLYSKNGMRSAAVSQFRACVRLLKDELDIEPDQETLQLFRELVGETDRDLLLGEALPQGESRVLYETQQAVAPRRVEDLPRHRRGTDVAWSNPSGVLVGRRQEIEQLSQVLLDMGTSAQRAVLVEGEAGSGKSHLVQSFLAGLEGAQAIVLHAVPGDRGDYAIWRRLIAAIRDREFNADTAHMPLVEAIDSFDTALTGDDNEMLLVRLEALMVAAADRGASFLVFEDLQLADAASLKLLSEALRLLTGLRTAVLLTLRRGEASLSPALVRFLADVGAERLADRLVLAPLSPRNIQELTRSLAAGLPNKKLSEARKAWVWAVSEGNPLVAIECLLDLSRLGPGQAPKEGSLPADLQARIDARTAVLSAPAKNLLLAAALVGREAAIDLLAAACDLEGAALADAVDELQAAHIVRVEGESLVFPWNRIRFAAANQAARQRRRVIHESLRDALLRLNAGRRLRVAEDLAFHSQAAGFPLSALRFETLAARRRLRQGNFKAAYKHFESLKAQAEDPSAALRQGLGPREEVEFASLRVSIRLAMAEAADYQDDATQAFAALEGIEAIEAIGEQGSDIPLVGTAARASVIRARLTARFGDMEAALGLAAKATGLARDRQEAGAWYAPDSLFDRLWLLQGRRAALQTWLEQRLAESADLGLQVDSVQLAVLESSLAGLDNNREAAIAAAARALETAEALGAARLVALAQQARGVAAIWAGEGDSAQESLSAGLTAADAAGDLFRAYLLRGFLGMAQALSGETDAAAETLAQSLVEAERLGTKLALPSFTAWRAEILAASGAKAGSDSGAGAMFLDAAHLSGQINSAWGKACLVATIEARAGKLRLPKPAALGCWTSGWPWIGAPGGSGETAR